jgi:hypothetical protein
MTCDNAVRGCLILGGGDKFRRSAEGGRAGGGRGVGDFSVGGHEICFRIIMSFATSSSLAYR